MSAQAAGEARPHSKYDRLIAAAKAAPTVTTIVVHVFLPQIYGFQPLIVAAQVALIAGYIFISFEAAREQSELHSPSVPPAD